MKFFNGGQEVDTPNLTFSEIKPEVKTELTEGASGSNEYGGSLAPGPSTSTTALGKVPNTDFEDKRTCMQMSDLLLTEVLSFPYRLQT